MNKDRNGWNIEPLSNFVNDLADGATPDRSVQSNFGGDIPWVVITDLKRLIEQTDENLSRQGLSGCAARLWPKETVILSTGATIGKVGIAKVPVATKQGITGLIPNNRITSRFLYYKLLSKKQKLNAWAQGSTFAEIRAPILRKLPLEVPGDLSVQNKISDVLEYADLAIERTEALIDKYQKVKTGLMQDLLTRGIGHDGQLRLPREQAPELYKETPIGWIPNDWSLSQIGDYVRSADYGVSTSLHDDETGIPVLRMNNIKDNSFEVSELKYSNDPEAYRLSLRKRDVLYNRTNSFEHVGKTAIWECNLDACSFASYLVRLNLNLDLILPEFFAHWMSQSSTQDALRRFATPGVQQVNINPTNVQRVDIAAPGIDEQASIVRRLEAMDHEILAEQNYLEKLQKQKTGLMHDLLTGKVSVPLEPEAEPEAVYV